MAVVDLRLQGKVDRYSDKNETRWIVTLLISKLQEVAVSEERENIGTAEGIKRIVDDKKRRGL